MSATSTRIPLAEAEAIAQEIVALLCPSCTRIEIVGSIRRRREDVGDVEIVCIPKPGEPIRDMFGSTLGYNKSPFEVACWQMLAARVFSHRLDTNGHRAYGERYKRLLYYDIPLDLFAVIEPAQWGVIYAIRTGSAEFSRRLVTPRYMRADGLLPSDYAIRDGQLWREPWSQEQRRIVPMVVPTPEEADLFRAIGLAWIPPEERV